MPQAGGAQTFAGEQAVGDQRARQAVLVLEQKAGFLERALLAGGVNAHQHLRARENGCKSIHGFGGELCPASIRGPQWALRCAGEGLLEGAAGAGAARAARVGLSTKCSMASGLPKKHSSRPARPARLEMG